MEKNNEWYYSSNAIFQATPPHKTPNLKIVEDGSIWKLYEGYPILARWVSDFDCPYKTEFWACILDKPFDISLLKAKRRYEVKKGTKNFFIKVLDDSFINEMYDVYIESLLGYKENISPIPYDDFMKNWSEIISKENFKIVGAFDVENNNLCGWAHCCKWDGYIAISTLKSRVTKEKRGVNFAIVNGICELYRNELEQGFYLCDGYRNLVHDTFFQDWLEKYFQFRKAYCILNIKYRGIVGLIIRMLYPFRTILHHFDVGVISKINSILKMEQWKRTSDSVSNMKK